MRRMTVAAVLGALLLTAGIHSPAAGGAHVVSSGSVPILLAGDSLTQGSDGDFTWRYRLWHFLAGTSVDFVGPRDDLFDQDAQAQGSHLYADPAFDTDHGAVWGTAFQMAPYRAEDLIAQYQPSVVVQAAGMNDLVWLQRPPTAVAADAAEFVRRSRSVDAEIDVILVPLPQVWFAQVVEYNRLLRDVAAQLDTPASRVIAAQTDQGIAAFVDTYDLAHLANTGEITFAAALADALSALGIGSPPPRVLPEVRNGPRQVADLRLTPRVRGFVLQWTDPPGASEEYAWLRDVTAKQAWHRLPRPLFGGRFVLRGLVPGHRYAVRLQAAKQAAISELYSRTVWVVPTARKRSPRAAATTARTAAATSTAPAAGGGTLRRLVGGDRGGLHGRDTGTESPHL